MAAGPKDDADWIEMLRGREAPGADRRTAAEAGAVRAAVRARDPVTDDSSSGLQALLVRMKAEGLFDVRRDPKLRARYAVAAVVIAAAIALGLLVRSNPSEVEIVQTRSLQGPIVRIIVQDPEKAARELVNALTSAGATVTSSPAAEGAVRLDVTVPAEKSVTVREALSRHGVTGLTGSRLRIDVLRR
jgi:hypothetical protein